MQARVLVVPLFLVLPGSLLAQETPFRAGQWGAQFTGGTSFVSLGVIRFRSPTRALIIDLNVSGAHQEHFTGDTVDAIDSQANLSLQLGRRSYRTVGDKVVAQHSFGVIAGYSHQVSSSPFGGTSKQHGWNLGPFAEVGGVYFITPHFGFGATGQVFVRYARMSGESPLGARTRTWSLGGGTSVRFAATILF